MHHKFALSAALTLCALVAAPAHAENLGNPFEVNALDAGYLVADAKDAKDTKDTKAAKNKSKNSHDKSKEAKCGEAKCGGNSKS